MEDFIKFIYLSIYPLLLASFLCPKNNHKHQSEWHVVRLFPFKDAMYTLKVNTRAKLKPLPRDPLRRLSTRRSKERNTKGGVERNNNCPQGTHVDPGTLRKERKGEEVKKKTVKIEREEI